MNPFFIVGIIAGILLVYVLVTYNILVKKENEVKESFATMDVYLKKRWDLIPNLVEIVKGCAKHERETLEAIALARGSNYDALNQDEKLATNKDINTNIVKLMAIAENYPELKANENFLNLSKELTEVEDEIAQSRKYFNAVVRLYNNKVEMFPSNIVAKILGFKSKEMFNISDDQKESVQVEI